MVSTCTSLPGGAAPPPEYGNRQRSTKSPRWGSQGVAQPPELFGNFGNLPPRTKSPRWGSQGVWRRETLGDTDLALCVRVCVVCCARMCCGCLNCSCMYCACCLNLAVCERMCVCTDWLSHLYCECVCVHSNLAPEFTDRTCSGAHVFESYPHAL